MKTASLGLQSKSSEMAAAISDEGFALRSAPRTLPCGAKSCDARSARSIFAENAVSGKNDLNLFRACERETLPRALFAAEAANGDGEGS